MAHALAGKPVQEQDIIDVQTIVDAYFDNVPDMTILHNWFHSVHLAIVVPP